MVKYHELPSFIFPWSLVFSWEKKNGKGRQGGRGESTINSPLHSRLFYFSPIPCFLPGEGRQGGRGSAVFPPLLSCPGFLSSSYVGTSLPTKLTHNRHASDADLTRTVSPLEGLLYTFIHVYSLVLHVQYLYSTCTIPVQHMYNTCTAHVQYLYSTCTTPVQHMYNTCTAHVQYLYSTCTIPIQHMYNTCTAHVQHMGGEHVVDSVQKWGQLAKSLMYQFSQNLCRGMKYFKRLPKGTFGVKPTMHSMSSVQAQ